MRRFIYFFVLLLSFVICQGCCSFKIPMIEGQPSLGEDFACAGKGVHVPLDRFIIKLKQNISDENVISIMEMVFPEQRPIEIKRCECGDPDLMMIILGEPMENKGDLLTSVTGLKGGKMNSDPILLYKMKHSVYKNFPDLPSPGVNPNIEDFISDESDAMVFVILDSGINLNRFTGEEFLFRNPTNIGCSNGEPSSGYNFVNNNTDIQDDKDSHGTLVTKQITEDLEGSGVKYKILPMKIAQDRHVSYWDLLCAMSFAKELKVEHNADIKIINASLGFQLNRIKLPLIDLLGIPNTIPSLQMSLLKEYVNDFSDSALMVTSAGNKHKDVDKNGKYVYYPAGFISDNLMAVGGLKEKEDIIRLHKKSNYGTTSIDIATPYEYDLMGNSVGGTSIGTAKMSASLAKFLNTNTSLTPLELKTQFLQNANASTALINFIKDGKYEQ